MTTMCLFYRRSVRHSYDASHSIKAALFDTTFTGDNYTAAPFPVTFHTMRTTDEFWGWLEGPLLEAIHPQLDASSRALGPNEQQYVLNANRVMGGVRMRQYRTGNTIAAGGCVSSTVTLKDGTAIGDVPVVKEKGCYADYSMDRQRIYVASLSANNGEDGETYVACCLILFDSLCSMLFYYVPCSSHDPCYTFVLLRPLPVSHYEQNLVHLVVYLLQPLYLATDDQILPLL
jgi:hypothetical protein